MGELNQTYHGLTLSRLDSEEVSRLSPLLLFLSLIGLCGIPGNSIVIYVYRKRWKTSNAKLFFVWLAIIDLLNCSVALPLEFVNVSHQYTYKYEWLCKVTIFSTYWLTLTSGITLVIITVDRFRKVCKPLKWQFSNKKARILCAVSFFTALGMSWPVVVLYGIHTFETDQISTLGSECSITNYYERTIYVRTYSGILTIGFAMTFTTTMLLYIIIGRQIFKQTKTRKDKLRNKSISKTDKRVNKKFECKQDGLSPDCVVETASKPSTYYHDRIEQQISHNQTRARKSALIMFLISLAFIVSFVPYLILRLLQALSADFVSSLTYTERALYKTFLRSYWLNCAINPFIYCACAREFRKECIRIWRKLICCRKQ